jgi:hypothetical protein
MPRILLPSLLLLFCGVMAAQQIQTNFPVGPQYMVTAPNGAILQPLETPSTSPSQPMGLVSPQTGQLLSPYIPGVPGAANLGAIYWGEPNPVVEVIEPPPSNALPQGYFDTGVAAITTDQTLRSEGYGMSLVQAARYWKQHKLHATHVYTNEDLKHLPNS